MHNEIDRNYLLKAVELSRKNMRKGIGGPFGAVIVKDGKIISEGWNEVTSSNDPTAHAEITAIRKACAALDDFSLKGAHIYTSCEPCPMCLSAIYWARIDKIFYANTRHCAADIGFDDSFLYDEIPLAVNERKIAAVRIHLPEANEVFEEWKNKEDRIEY